MITPIGIADWTVYPHPDTLTASAYQPRSTTKGVKMDKWGIARLGSSRITQVFRTKAAMMRECARLDKQGIETTQLKWDDECGWEVWA